MTIDDWNREVTALLEPVYDAYADLLRAEYNYWAYVFAEDERRKRWNP